MRGIRGAICAPENTKEAIYNATQQLLVELARRNDLKADDIVAAFFTMTPDLSEGFPAYAARDMGWSSVPMLGAQESLIAGAPERSIRVLVLASTEGPARHVYLGRAVSMRPDLAEPGDGEMGDGHADPADSKTSPLGRLLVIGLGLIGGSLAAAAKASGFCERVYGYDHDPDATATALKRRLVDSSVEVLESELGKADIVVLATPVFELARAVERLGPHLRPGAIVTDVGSTKRVIVQAMSRLPHGVRAVGGHPLTGDTRSGPSAADASLFRGARWALVDTERSDEDAFDQLERLVRAVGAQPVRMSAEVHDEIVAVTSHLPAAMAIALLELAVQLPAGIGIGSVLTGPGFASASRLVAGDPTMTAQMLADNADHVGTAVDGLIARLEELRELAVNDPRALARRIAAARSSRSVLLAGGLG